TLNNHIFKIIDSYNSLKNIVEFKTKVLKLENEKIAVLPIGFLPSNILANIYLVDLDRLIEEQFYPVNYGRYVDDISFLVKKRISDGDNETTVKKIIEDIGKIKDEIEKKYVDLNKDKTLFFIIDKKNDINYLNKFEKETQKLSSDNYRLIDPNEYDKEFENAYNLTKDITKMSDLFTIVRDKKFISRTISTIFYYIFWNLKKDIHEQNIELSKKFIKYFYSFVDDEFFLEL
ncbi:TPA: reverse transcriptase domain-containing protein, partial [Streptococcus suis]